MAAGAASGDLLYVSDDGYGAVLVYSYDQQALKFVGMLTEPSQPGPICVDKDQNVWVMGSYNSESFAATEYAHGGTSPIDVISDPAGFVTGCGVDPTTGDLALSSRPAIDGEVAAIAVFSHDHRGPVLHKDANAEFFDCCTYDQHGNLYGYGGVSNDSLVIAELPAHSRKFVNIPLGNDIDSIEGLQWAGKYLTVGNESEIEQFTISRHTATLAGTVSLSGISYLQRYLIDRNRIIVANTKIQGQGYVNLYDYPKGGSPLGRREFEQPVALALSRASH